MTKPILEPSIYPPTVTLVRRLTRPEASEPAPTTAAEIEAWLLADATTEDDTLALVDAFAWRLAATDLGVDRLSLHAGTLHPQAVGFAWNWMRASGTCDEVRASLEAPTHESFRLNPLVVAIELGETFRGATDDPSLKDRYPIMHQLAEQGLTDYVVFPIGRERTGRNSAATVATSRPGGFTPEMLARIQHLFRILALHLRAHVARRISQNIVRTYLGQEAGNRVLDGTISRGAGVSGQATIWMSDLRGFTSLSERLAPETMLALLDAYFDVMAGAVLDEGGEVLKFIGDGLLAGFARPGANEREGAAAALRAAERALAGLAALNAVPPPSLAAASGWHPLETGIGLHFGHVFFGNVGAPERLDFTVIGGAVNLASRIEGLCRPLGRPVLLTEAVADLIDEPLDDLGLHQVKGVGEPIRIFAPTR